MFHFHIPAGSNNRTNTNAKPNFRLGTEYLLSVTAASSTCSTTSIYKPLRCVSLFSFVSSILQTMTNKVKNQYFFGVFHYYSLGWTEQMARQPHVPITCHELDLNWRLGQKCSEDRAGNAGSAPSSEGKDKSSIPFGIPHNKYL